MDKASNFQQNGYAIIRKMIDPILADFISKELKLLRDNFYLVEGFDKNTVIGDGLVNGNNFFYYGNQATETLLEYIKPIMETTTGKQLLPTYSYLRIYYEGAVMPRHTDRPSCEYSATLSLSVDDDPWEIYMDGNPVILYPGDAAVYKGMEVEHHRENPYKGKEQIQVFLHFVDADGDYANLQYDERPMLGLR
jgi:hypothetical protein